MTTHSFFINPVLPLEVLALMSVLVLGLGGYHFWRKAAISPLLRSLAGLILIATLLNLEINTEKRVPIKDVVVVIVDQSSSQQIGTRKAQTEQALEHVREEISRHPDLEMQLLYAHADAREGKYGTRLANVLKQARSGIDPHRYSGAIFISDGQIHDLDKLKETDGPVHLLVSGSRTDFDRRIEIVDAPKYAIVDAPFRVVVRVLDQGIPVRDAPLTVRFPDGKTFEVPPSQKQNGERELTYRLSKSGPSLTLLETPDLAGEVSLQNNRVAVPINGVRDRLRVLLVSGMPHQGQRTWRNLLRSDPAVDLVHFTILRPSEKEDFTPLNELSLIAFPVRELFEEKLDDFNLVIFDRYFQRSVLSDTYYENIRDYLKRGGAVLVSAGPDFSGPLSLAGTPLGSVMPALPNGALLERQPYRLMRPDVGLRHPITAPLGPKDEKWGRWTRLVEVEKFRGETLLASENGQPVLIVDRVENGRIALMLSDHIWLWARGFDGGGPHQTLIRHLIHWLMKEPDLEEERLVINSLETGQLEIVRQSLGQTDAPVSLTLPNGTVEEIILRAGEDGHARAVLDAAPPGIYRAEHGELQGVGTHGAVNPLELVDPRANDQAFLKVLHETGGSVHWIEEGLARLQHVNADIPLKPDSRLLLRKNDASNLSGIQKTALIAPWMAVLLLGSLIGFLWWRESR